MGRWLGCGLLLGVLLGLLPGCGGTPEPAKQEKPLPSSRFPHKPNNK
jgi:hypothetical protein